LQPLDAELQSYAPSILRVFTAHSVEEVRARLADEIKIGEAAWARETLALMDKNSPQALELTLKLLHRARTLDYKACLEAEFRAAVNLVVRSRQAEPEFLAAAEAKLSWVKQPHEWSKSPVSPDKITELLDKESAELGLSLQSHSFLPAKSYLDRIPHAPLHWLNQTTPQKAYYREDFDFDVQFYFNTKDIDTRNGILDVAAVRRSFYHYDELRRLQEDELNRHLIVSRDGVTRRLIYGRRLEAINKLTKDKEALSETVDQMIAQIFNEAFKERIATIQDACKNAHGIEMKEFLKEYKDFLHRERFYVTPDIAEEIDHDASLDDLNIPFRIGKSTDSLEDLIAPLVPPDLQRFKFSDFVNYSQLKAFYRGSIPRLLTPDSEASLKRRLEQLSELTADVKDGYSFEQKLMAFDDSFSKIDVMPTSPAENLADAEDDRLSDDNEECTWEEEYEDSLEADQDHKPSVVLAKKIAEELYVKTGFKDPSEALNALRSPDFSLNLQAMKTRRAEVVQLNYGGTDKVRTSLKSRRLLYKYFGELLIRPQMDEVDESIYQALEVESFNDLQDLISSTRLGIDRQKLNVDSFFESDEESILEIAKAYMTEVDPVVTEQPRTLVDLPFRLSLDKKYLKAVYGDRAFIEPSIAELDDEAFKKHCQDMRLVDLNIPPLEWARNAMHTYLKQIFDERKAREQYIDRAGLQAYDRGLQAHFTQSAVKRGMLTVMNKELNSLRAHDKYANFVKAQEVEQEVQEEKVEIPEMMVKNTEFHRFIDAHLYQENDLEAREEGKKRSERYLSDLELATYTAFLYNNPKSEEVLREAEYFQKWSAKPRSDLTKAEVVSALRTALPHKKMKDPETVQAYIQEFDTDVKRLLPTKS
jgi:hypothetical protein